MKNWSGANMTSLSSQISTVPTQEIILSLRNPLSSLGPILSLAVRCMQGCFGSQLSRTHTQCKPNLRIKWVSEANQSKLKPYYMLVGQSVWLLCWKMHLTLCTNTRLAQIWCLIESNKGKPNFSCWSVDFFRSSPHTNSCSWLILYIQSTLYKCYTYKC